MDVVALHRLPPTTAFSCTDDTVEAADQESDSSIDIEQRRAEIHGLKMAFLLSGVVEEEPRTIESSRVHITENEARPILSRGKSYECVQEEDTPESSENELQYGDDSVIYENINTQEKSNSPSPDTSGSDGKQPRLKTAMAPSARCTRVG